MNNENVLNNLQKRSDSLKSKLLRNKLKHGNFSSGYFEKYSLCIIHEYEKHHSLFKAAKNCKINPKLVMDWYVQGQLGNDQFRSFYITINKINRDDGPVAEEVKPVSNDENVEGDYVISEYGDGWSYKTYVGGEKIFIISNGLETLKKKVKAKNLPID